MKKHDVQIHKCFISEKDFISYKIQYSHSNDSVMHLQQIESLSVAI